MKTLWEALDFETDTDEYTQKSYSGSLKQAFRQLPVDPDDLWLLVCSWHGKIFMEQVLTMGLRSTAMMCQSVTTVASHVH